MTRVVRCTLPYCSLVSRYVKSCCTVLSLFFSLSFTAAFWCRKTAKRNILKERICLPDPCWGAEVKEQRCVFVFSYINSENSSFLFSKKKKKKEALTSGAVVGFGSSSGACGHEGENISCPGTSWPRRLGVIPLSGGSGRMRNTNQTCLPTTRSCCLTLLLLLLSGILRLSCPLTLQTAPVLDFNPPIFSPSVTFIHSCCSHTPHVWYAVVMWLNPRQALRWDYSRSSANETLNIGVISWG